MTPNTRALVLVLVSAILCGCGGVADCIANHELMLHVTRRGHPLSERPVAVTMHADKIARSKEHEVTTNTAGEAHTTFETGWSAAFLVIPPVGLVPSRPPKPVYSVTLEGKQLEISPSTPGVVYRWEKGSWHTDAALTLP